MRKILGRAKFRDRELCYVGCECVKMRAIEKTSGESVLCIHKRRFAGGYQIKKYLVVPNPKREVTQLISHNKGALEFCLLFLIEEQDNRAWEFRAACCGAGKRTSTQLFSQTKI